MRLNAKRQFHSDASDDTRVCVSTRRTSHGRSSGHTPERKLRYFVDDVRARKRGGDFTRNTCDVIYIRIIEEEKKIEMDEKREK